MSRKIALTGIKPTGIPHIGNYVGAIRPALELAKEYEARYFIADYHALNQVRDADLLRQMIYEIAAAWLACGLDPETMLFYKQSAVPETFELAIILMAFTPKGLMNRAHAYKAMVQANKETGKEVDEDINMGLFTYPVLMAADILLFDADVVPVGKDQFQHLEMTADIAETINFNYHQPLLKVPEPLATKETAVVVGLDGRKMSKSYNNAIPIFIPEKELRKLLMKIVTNSQTLEEPKNPDESSIFSLYKLFATPEQIEALRHRYLAGGMGWGHAKQELFEVMNAHLTPLREKYDSIINDHAYIDGLLKQGSEKAREVAAQTLARLRKAVGVV
jgi:tryptophanyl-tRNA synthetase